MGLLDGRKGLVFGVANDRSIACHVAEAIRAEGGVCGYAHLPGDKSIKRVRSALSGIGEHDPWLQSCDVCNDDDLDAVFEAAREKFDTIDFVINSVAYADRAYLRPEIGRASCRERV